MSLLIAVEDLELVREFELFEEPEDTLRAGLLEPGSEMSVGVRDDQISWILGTSRA